MVGGRDFEQSNFNRATQAKRQPGSAFKPFVYAAALEQGFTPGTVITNLDDPIMTLQGEWVPEDEHGEDSSMTMRAALKTSSNRAAVRMLEDVGIPVAVQYAKKLGVGSVPSVPSLALGSGEVTVASMTAAYAAFANAGMVQAPILVRRVETTDGKVLFEAKQEPQQGVSEQTAFLMANMLADVVNAGTGAPARSVGFRLPAAGKTGTTNDYHDAWFVGFTPRLATGVWIGYDQPRTIIGGGYASVLAVPVWGRFMAAATSKDRPEWFSAPENVTSATICRLSGKLATDSCNDHSGTADGEGETSGSNGLHRVLRAGHGTHRVMPDSPPDHSIAAESAGRSRLAGPGFLLVRVRRTAAAACACRSTDSCSAPDRSTARTSAQAWVLGKAVRRRRSRRKNCRFCSPPSWVTVVCCLCCRVRSRVTRCRRRCCWPALLASESGALRWRSRSAVNCLDPRSTTEFEREACGKCASCRRIGRGMHPDVIVIEPGDTGSIKIEASPRCRSIAPAIVRSRDVVALSSSTRPMRS